mmetsp:Transcript_343/g.1156  ORF Transcript_343/g.1156 Transcript_343/m.1156 type:complete len:274 (+) Transcript_343:99-920(+)|eukprot:CAMPEP_0198727572 /NCGR_PEP_ID=MMETSP1475-20131203/4520_1 /TAXON_ID= ORGANISM="Unidentified sp., Strain CCMP1999" /NCGR_SAMPLE_ID=MMETSP1475 /ASSEMBLY_ACC=CAM_ASM_001111 /LENGTH=273 /DNA_ID=CAMNT_0044489627 /DNA_START=72 /DNA_END=893 /DNA_ORIENTATION=+
MNNLIAKFENGANSAAPAPAPAAAAPPPPGPPPPPPPPKMEDLQAMSKADGASDAGGAGALFAEINSLGEGGVRAGLKKATRGPVNDSAPAKTAAPTAPKPAAPVKKAEGPKKEPRVALEGKKWVVEYFEGDQTIEVNVNSIKETVYIFRCNKSTIQIKGKCNSIAIDSCKKFNCVFESALSTCEIVNSSDIQVQSTGKASSMTIDNCNTVTCYLSAESLGDAHIVTSKCAAINLCAPKPDDPEDMFETPIPEQMVTKFTNGQWTTDFVDHSD